MFAVGSASDVRSTNFVPARRDICSEINALNIETRRLTSGSKKDRHLERLRLDNVRTRACTSRGESTRDSVYTVQRAGKDEVLVGSELS